MLTLLTPIALKTRAAARISTIFSYRVTLNHPKGLCDHFPIKFFFSIPLSVVDKGLRSRRSVPYDVKRVGDAECDAVFLNALSYAPPIPLVVEPSPHCRLLEEVVVSAACDAYPFLKTRKKKEWLSDVSLKLLHDRDCVLRKFQKRKKSLHNFTLHAVFSFWARRQFKGFPHCGVLVLALYS